MKKHLNFIFVVLLIAFLACALNATTLTSTLTVDNVFNIYISTSDSTAGTNLGGDSNWPGATTYTTNLNTGQDYYLHIYARDSGGPAGLLGQFSLNSDTHTFANGSTTVYTNTSSNWRTSRTGWGSYTGVSDFGANGVSPWGTIGGISGSARWIWSSDNNAHNVEYFSMKITATSMPVVSVNSNSFGNVRVGTSANASVTVTNAGDSGTTLTGNIGPASGSEFTPTSGNQSFSLAQNQQSSRTFSYTPSDRGTDSTTVTVNTNEDGNLSTTLTGTGVSPVFNSSVAPESTIDFGMIHLNTSILEHPDIPSTKYETITISNITTDSDLGDLTDLTILNAYITGDTPFEIIGFTPTVLGKGESFNITIRYSAIIANNGGIAPSQGLKNAVLTLVTDQNAALGETGDVFTFNLTGEVVPEPGSIILSGIAICLLAFWGKMK